jgi:hypothetical protein
MTATGISLSEAERSIWKEFRKQTLRLLRLSRSEYAIFPAFGGLAHFYLKARLEQWARDTIRSRISDAVGCPPIGARRN